MTKFRKVELEIKVNASKEKVWDLLFNRFGEVNAFNPLIEGSTASNELQGAVGAERICDIDAKNSVHEKIVATRGTSGFDVDIIKGGMPMMNEMKGSFDLATISSNQTKIMFTMKYNTKPAFMAPLMSGMMAKMLQKMLVGLKYHLETDQLVTKANINSIMKGFKNLNKGEGYQAKELASA